MENETAEKENFKNGDFTLEQKNNMRRYGTAIKRQKHADVWLEWEANCKEKAFSRMFRSRARHTNKREIEIGLMEWEPGVNPCRDGTCEECANFTLERQNEKQATRDEDARLLSSGEMTVEELRAKNNFFYSIKDVKINLK